MKKFDLLKYSERTYMMTRALDDDFQPCYRIVTEVQEDLTKMFMQFPTKAIAVIGEEQADGLIPVKLNWEFLSQIKNKDFAWLVPVIDTISPHSELEMFQALSYFFNRIEHHLSRKVKNK